MIFTTEYELIIAAITAIDPEKYGRTRNYVDGAVTRLSPYISRGVISTKQVFESLLSTGLKFPQMERLVQELAWRDYFQRVLQHHKTLFNDEIKQAQSDVLNLGMPKRIVEAETGITVIDEAVKLLYQAGYMHNHLRMYVSSVTCNIARSHWRTAGQWMYYHLLDADVASNFCSWQWICGAFSSKKYYANQQNINQYGYSDQHGTFLDRPYEDLPGLPVPEALREIVTPELSTVLPGAVSLAIPRRKPTAIYNFYNLDPLWHKGEDLNRVLLLEPSHFAAHPVAPHTVDFILALAKNIPGIQLYIGEFDDYVKTYYPEKIFYREHPLFNYKGVEERRDWMFPEITGYYPSFFGFWKQCQKQFR